MSYPTRLTFLYSTLIPSGGISCDASIETSYPLTNLTGDVVSTVCRTMAKENNTKVIYTVDLGTAASVDTFAIGGHNFSTSGGTFRVTTGSPSITNSWDITMTEGHMILHASPEVNATYWRFEASQDTSDGYYELGVVWCGMRTELDVNPQIPIDILYNHNVTSMQTAGGQKWTYNNYTQRGYTFKFITDFSLSNYETLRAVFADRGYGKPFFFHLKPYTCNASLYADPDDLLFAHFEEWSFSIDGKDARPGTVTILEEL